MSRDSATCRYYRKDKSATIPINQNHSSMVKFSRGDATMGVIISLIKETCSPCHILLQHSEINAGVSARFDNNLPKDEATVENNTQYKGIARLDLPCEEALRTLGKLFDGLDGMSSPFP